MVEAGVAGAKGQVKSPPLPPPLPCGPSVHLSGLSPVWYVCASQAGTGVPRQDVNPFAFSGMRRVC